MKTTLTRRTFIQTSAVSVAGLSYVRSSFSAGQELRFYVGGYASNDQKGIHLCSLNTQTGELSIKQGFSGVINPSYLCLSPNKQFLYAVNETGKFKEISGGSITAFAIDQNDHSLRLLNQQASHGGSPCYVCVDQQSAYVFLANYNGGNAASYAIQPDGSLSEALSIVQHEGSSVNPRRQKKAYAHSIVLSPDNRFAFVADLGIDKLMIYRCQEGKLIANQPPFVQVQPGAGPRHFTFHPNGKLAFLINELDCTLMSFTYDADKGALHAIQTVPSLPQDYSGNNTCADIHVHPSGKFLYGSNRGHDSIVAYAIAENGTLTYIAHESTQGKTPRNFALDPQGHFLLAANQETGNIVSYRIDAQSGKLTPTGHAIEINRPVCIKFL
jgi:6-phosphogluconolactonase